MSKLAAFKEYLLQKLEDIDEENISFVEPMILKYETDTDIFEYYAGTEKEIQEFALRHVWKYFWKLEYQDIYDNSTLLQKRFSDKDDAFAYLDELNNDLNKQAHACAIVSLIDDMEEFSKFALEEIGLFVVLYDDENEEQYEDEDVGSDTVDYMGLQYRFIFNPNNMMLSDSNSKLSIGE